MKKELINVCPNWVSFNGSVAIPKNTTYVFRADVAEYASKIADKYAGILSSVELEKAARFVNQSDCNSFISGRYLLRHVLSSLFDVLPHNVPIKYSKRQKPYSEGIEFNLSHSGNLVLLALSHFPVGVDIELVKEDFEYDVLSSSVFNMDETRFIAKSQSKTRDFFTLWTRKEAILKATGEGLVDNMENVNCLKQTAVRNKNVFELTSISIENEYVATVAVNNIKENIIRYVQI